MHSTASSTPKTIHGAATIRSLQVIMGISTPAGHACLVKTSW
jgi:hypothetical protein